MAQTLRAACLALRCVAFFAFRFRSVARESRSALHPLKCLKEGPVAPAWGGGASHLNFALYRSQTCVAVQGVSQLQCRESRYTTPLRNPEEFDQTIVRPNDVLENLLHVEFALTTRELVKAEVFEKRCVRANGPIKMSKMKGAFSLNLLVGTCAASC